MSSFTKPLVLKILQGGDYAELVEEFSYYDTVDGVTYTVPAGFITDFATTPWWSWSFFPKIGPWTKASVLHDYLYKEAIKDKAWADKEFHAAMLILDTPRIKAYVMYLAVKFFGRGNYYVGKL